MSADRRSWLSRSRRRVEADPELVLEEMEAATQRLRDQAWKINATTRARLIPEEEARTDATAEVGPPPARQGPPAAS